MSCAARLLMKVKDFGNRHVTKCVHRRLLCPLPVRATRTRRRSFDPSELPSGYSCYSLYDHGSRAEPPANSTALLPATRFQPRQERGSKTGAEHEVLVPLPGLVSNPHLGSVNTSRILWTDYAERRIARCMRLHTSVHYLLPVLLEPFLRLHLQHTPPAPAMESRRV